MLLLAAPAQHRGEKHFSSANNKQRPATNTPARHTHTHINKHSKTHCDYIIHSTAESSYTEPDTHTHTTLCTTLRRQRHRLDCLTVSGRGRERERERGMDTCVCQSFRRHLPLTPRFALIGVLVCGCLFVCVCVFTPIFRHRYMSRLPDRCYSQEACQGGSGGVYAHVSQACTHT